MSLLFSFCFLQHHFYVPTMHYLASCCMLKGVIITLNRRSIYGSVCQWDRSPGYTWRLANWTTRVIHLWGWGGRYFPLLFVLWRWHIKNTQRAQSRERSLANVHSQSGHKNSCCLFSLSVFLFHRDLFGLSITSRIHEINDVCWKF